MKAFQVTVSLAILILFFCGYFGAQVASWIVNYTPEGVPKPIGMARGMPDRREFDRHVHRLMIMSSATANLGPIFGTNDGQVDWQAVHQDSMQRIHESIYDREYCRNKPELWECAK